MRGIDLNRQRDLGGLLETAFALYRTRFTLLFALAFLIVAPVDLLLLGIGDGWLWGDYEDNFVDGPGADGIAIAYNVIMLLVVPALIGAAHAHVIKRIGEGEEPTVGQALRGIMPVAAPVVGAVVLATVLSALGLLLLIAPGVWLWIRFTVATQAAALDGTGAAGALRRSAGLVRHNWWRTLGITIVFGLIAVIGGIVLALPAELAAWTLDYAGLSLLGGMLANSVFNGFTALGITLLYFDLRVRHGEAAAAHGLATAPERPAPPPAFGDAGP